MVCKSTKVQGGTMKKIKIKIAWGQSQYEEDNIDLSGDDTFYDFPITIE